MSNTKQQVILGAANGEEASAPSSAQAEKELSIKQQSGSIHPAEQIQINSTSVAIAVAAKDQTSEQNQKTDHASGQRSNPSEDVDSDDGEKVQQNGNQQVNQFGKRTVVGKMVPFFDLIKFATRQDKIHMIIGTIGAVVSGAAIPFLAVVFGGMVNGFGPSSTPDMVVHDSGVAAMWFAIIGAIVFLSSWVGFAYWLISGENQAIDIRKMYFRALLKQEIGWFDRINPNELATKVLQQSLDIQNAIGEKVATFLLSFSQVVSGFIIAYCYGWQLSLVCTAVLPALSLSSFAFFFLLQQMRMQTERIYEVAGGVAEQAIQGVKTVKCLRGEDFEAKRYETHVREAMERSIKFTFFIGFTQGCLYFSMFCNYALSFWYGAKLIYDQTNNPVVKRSYNVGDVMIIFFAIQAGSLAIGQGLPTLEQFAQGRIAGYSVFKILDRKPKVRNDYPGVNLPNLRGNFSFQDVEFEYPAKRGVPVLKKISFEIEAGKKTALVGESGSGKSTCMQLLERFYDVEKGKLLLDGVELKKLDLDWLRDNIGYVGQEPVLFASSIRENLLFGKKDATEQEMWDALDKANVKKFVMGLDKKLDTFVGAAGSQMSGGQKQRICIARAILKNPKILLLDEATSALDRANELSIQKTLDEISRGRTTIVVAHRLTTVRNSDKILVLDFGKVCESGTHEELIKKGGRYETLAKNQLQGEIDAAYVTIESFANEDATTDPKKKINIIALNDAFQILRQEAEKQNKTADVFLRARYSDLKMQSLLEQYHKRLSSRVNIQSAQINFVQVLQIVTELANQERRAQGEEIEAAHHSAADANSTENASIIAGVQPIARKLSEQLSAQSPEKLKVADNEAVVIKDSQKIKQTAESEKQEAINRLYQYDNPEKKSLYIACVFSFINGICLPLSALLMAKMIFKMSDYYDPTVSHADYKKNINLLALYYFLIAIASCVCNTGAKSMFSRVGEGLTYSIRLNVFKKIMHMPVYWFDDPEHNPGTLSVRLGSEAKTVNNLVSNVVDLQFGLTSTFGTAIIIGFINSWQITLLAIALAPLQILSGALRSKWVRGSSAESDEAYKDSGNLIQESVSNIRTVVSFGNENILLGFLNERLKKPQSMIPSKSNVAGLSLGISNMAQFVIYAIIFYVGAVLHRSNGLSLENMLAAVFTVIFACMRAGYNLHFAGDIGEAENAATNIFKILDAQDEVQIQNQRKSHDKLLRPAKVLGDIEFKNVVFKYPVREKIILKGISFKVNAGSKTAFVGASGCGKSTIMQILLRYYDIVSGEVLLDGQNILDYDIEYLRGYFGIVQQEPVVFQGTIAENIRYNQENMTQEQIRRFAEQANALGFIERDEKVQQVTHGENGGNAQQIAIDIDNNNRIGLTSGFNKQVGAKGSQISGGQKQRIAIARAIAKNPQILLLDEATSALDSENEKIVQESLDVIMKNKTTLVIAHRISTIKDSNLIIVMEEGQIVEAGSYEELLNQKGYFYRLERGEVK